MKGHADLRRSMGVKLNGTAPEVLPICILILRAESLFLGSKLIENEPGLRRGLHREKAKKRLFYNAVGRCPGPPPAVNTNFDK